MNGGFTALGSLVVFGAAVPLSLWGTLGKLGLGGSLGASYRNAPGSYLMPAAAVGLVLGAVFAGLVLGVGQ